MSSWFQTYGYASVHDHLIVGAMPLDAGDVRLLSAFGVTRVLNLVQDSEYRRGARRTVERALAGEGITERRVSTEDFGNLSPELLDQATSQVNSWLDDQQVVYLHCRAGWQRSVAVAAGVIALRDELPLDTALLRIQALKDRAEPLPHQLGDLQRWFDARVNGRR